MSDSSYVVLGFVRQRGAATPYDLKQHIAGSIGYFWDFPHSQLYSEPARLADAGLLHEVREEGGRRRRTYSITDEGEAALDDWLDEPTEAVTEIRDRGLLKLFFSDGRDADEIDRLVRQQVLTHRARLAEYEALAGRLESEDDAPLAVRTLQLGLRYERLAMEFWEETGEQL